MFIDGTCEKQELRQEFHVSSSRETPFTPKGANHNSGPMAINIQPLRGWTLNGVKTLGD